MPDGRRRVSATRSALLRARTQLTHVQKGAHLIRRKREALVAHLFSLARPAVDAREAIQESVNEAYAALAGALATNGVDALRALAAPQRPVHVELHPAQIWGVSVADVTRTRALRRTLDARGTSPGSTGPAATEAATRFERLADLLLDAASREMRVARLATAVAQTSQQLHVLEQRLEPALRNEIAYVRRTLEEREREEHLALKHLQKAKRAKERETPKGADARKRETPESAEPQKARNPRRRSASC